MIYQAPDQTSRTSPSNHLPDPLPTLDSTSTPILQHQIHSKHYSHYRSTHYRNRQSQRRNAAVSSRSARLEICNESWRCRGENTEFRREGIAKAGCEVAVCGLCHQLHASKSRYYAFLESPKSCIDENMMHLGAVNAAIEGTGPIQRILLKHPSDINSGITAFGRQWLTIFQTDIPSQRRNT